MKKNTRYQIIIFAYFVVFKDGWSFESRMEGMRTVVSFS